jgi:hypothetical protein
MKASNLISLLILAMLVAPAAAVPNTLPATLISSNNVTLNCNGVTGTDVWFKIGLSQNTLPWQTDNSTSNGGLGNATLIGTPLYSGYTYYYLACDQSGCAAVSNEQTFTVTVPTPIPTTTYGIAMNNMTQSRFNIFYIVNDLLMPLTWAIGANGLVLVTSIFLAMVYLAYWRTGGSTRIPSIMGILSGVFLWSGSAGVVNISPVFSLFGQGLLYASIAGLLLSFIKRG